MDIRIATKDDLHGVLYVHQICFPASEHFTTLMGGGHKNLTELMYLEYLIEDNLFLVAEDKNQIIGFCMGNLYTSKAMGNFYKKYRLQFLCRTCSLLLVGNVLAWKKVVSTLMETLKKKEGKRLSQDVNRPSASLRSICVLPECRGDGVAQKLVAEFERLLKDRGVKAYTLGTWPGNERAIAFYKKMGLRERFLFEDKVQFIKDLE